MALFGRSTRAQEARLIDGIDSVREKQQKRLKAEFAAKTASAIIQDGRELPHTPLFVHIGEWCQAESRK
jgi:hypothetical protein